ncbi:YwqI/YxiC family protein [Bacillus marasmi]|uniref:YwqI/YxiC family protein n=1 Tax=Bacillus marasmi TaxID=1926279 RepID=UPI0011CA7EBA|nr:YwqI/YxiC family protein [Bacillus marasmi]
MNTIQLKHDEVMKRLTKVKEALAALALPNPNEQVLGNNKLDFADQWTSRETAIASNFASYIEIVSKNIEDTRSNVSSIKQQDEAIANGTPK